MAEMAFFAGQMVLAWFRSGYNGFSDLKEIINIRNEEISVLAFLPPDPGSDIFKQVFSESFRLQNRDMRIHYFRISNYLINQVSVSPA